MFSCCRFGEEARRKKEKQQQYDKLRKHARASSGSSGAPLGLEIVSVSRSGFSGSKILVENGASVQVVLRSSGSLASTHAGDNAAIGRPTLKIPPPPSSSPPPKQDDRGSAVAARREMSSRGPLAGGTDVEARSPGNPRPGSGVWEGKEEGAPPTFDFGYDDRGRNSASVALVKKLLDLSVEEGEIAPDLEDELPAETENREAWEEEEEEEEVGMETQTTPPARGSLQTTGRPGNLAALAESPPSGDDLSALEEATDELHCVPSGQDEPSSPGPASDVVPGSFESFAAGLPDDMRRQTSVQSAGDRSSVYGFCDEFDSEFLADRLAEVGEEENLPLLTAASTAAPTASQTVMHLDASFPDSSASEGGSPYRNHELFGWEADV